MDFQEDELIQVLKDLKSPTLSEDLKKIQKKGIIRMQKINFEKSESSPNEVIKNLYPGLSMVDALNFAKFSIFEVLVPQCEFNNLQKWALMHECLIGREFEKVDFLLTHGFPEESPHGEHIYIVSQGERYLEQFMGYTHKNLSEYNIVERMKRYVKENNYPYQRNFVKKFIKYCPEVTYEVKFEISDSYYEKMKILAENNISVKDAHLAQDPKYRKLFNVAKIQINNLLKEMSIEDKKALLSEIINNHI